MRQAWRHIGQALLAAAAMAAIAGPAHAQLSSKGGPISYSADSLEYADSDRRLVLTGAVDIVQDDSRLRAQRVTLFFSGGGQPTTAAGGQAGLGSGDIERMVAEGRVYYVRPDQRAVGDRAEYVAATDTVTFRGNVVIESVDNVIRGETVVLQMTQRRTTITPNRDAGGRVRGVLRPDRRPGPAPR